MTTEQPGASPALSDQLGAHPEACKWTQEDYDSDVWNTDCGDAMCLNEGTPGDNFMRFCCYCGKPLESVTAAILGADA